MHTSKYNNMRICRLFIIFLLLWTTGLSKAFAYDFSAVCETGQTLYFNIIDDTQHYVELTFPGSYSWSGWNGFDNLVGEMVLPSVVLYNDFEYVVTEIANNAFSNCYSITSVVIPNTIVYIRYEAFKNCVGLNFISLSNSVTSIEYDAFFHCSGFTSISIPNSVTSIGKGAFCGCNGITSISIPNSVTSMGYAVFENCPNLEMIVVETGNPNYDSRDNCNAIIETCSSELVQGCKNTIIPNTISSIGRGAFCGCSGLASIEIPNTVTVISHNAFNGCGGLESITIPNSVIYLGDQAFAGCYLNSVTAMGTIPPSLGNNVFRTNNPKLIVPCVGAGAYKESSWDDYFKTIECRGYYSIFKSIDGENEASGTFFNLPERYLEEEEVHFSVKPNLGCYLSSITIQNAENPNETVPIVQENGDKYLFVMPSFPISVRAVFAIGNATDENIAIPFAIYPNPTSGKMKLESENIKHVIISHILGHIVYESNAEGDSFEYDFSDYEAGVYLIQITTSAGVTTKRILVSRKQ